MRFSQRHGHSPVRTNLQREEMDQDLRNRLWNACFLVFLEAACDVRQGEVDSVDRFFNRLWHSFFKWSLETLPVFYQEATTKIARWLGDAEWFEALDFVEFLSSPASESESSEAGKAGAFSVLCNQILEEEMSAYRIVNNQVVEITDPNEIKVIEESAGLQGPWAVVSQHIDKASRLLFDRKKPDFPNSVKEAISAVESACCLVSGKKATLGETLKIVEKMHPIHPALKQAFEKLYGYTSDEDGIRHGGIDLSQVTFEEAKYMLVACAAFVNYLKALAARKPQ